MSKSSGIIIGLPFLLLVLIMQVYGLWGWLSREGFIQYFLMGEVYLLLVISFLYLRSIYDLKNLGASILTLLLIPSFYLLFSTQEGGLGGMLNSLWYINILISLIASAWLVVFSFGLYFLVGVMLKKQWQLKMFLVFALLICLSALMSYFIVNSHIPDAVILQIWKADKLRTLWFFFEPVLVLSFSLITIFLYLKDKNLTALKKQYAFIALVILSFGFEYMINGLGLVSLRSVLYFLGLYSFMQILKNEDRMNYFLIFLLVALVFLHLNHYSGAPNFYTIDIFIPFFHNALIESTKLFLVIYIFMTGWQSVKSKKLEFRLIMLLIPIIAYTYTTQSGGNGVQFYDIVAITAMLKLTAAFMIILYSFYYFRKDPKTEKVSQ
ncbi:MAG: hypothetical protein COA44_08355 [Arcobacter sp.]|nr:MAG: hypothetical protein COA44_08355 [Arcobacter sp.]